MKLVNKIYYSKYAITILILFQAIRFVNFRDELVLNAFAKKFKSIRLKKNLTQEELALRAEISLSQIARIETGRINPTLCTIVILAKTLKIHPKELLDFDA